MLVLAWARGGTSGFVWCIHGAWVRCIVRFDVPIEPVTFLVLLKVFDVFSAHACVLWCVTHVLGGGIATHLFRPFLFSLAEAAAALNTLDTVIGIRS